MRKQETQVLVVGAGPVGLATALLLSEAGAEVQIIDREIRTAARSYACALHSSTLKLLQRLGLADTLIKQGRQVSTVGLYEGQQRRAALDLARVGGAFPYMLIVPQSTLERVLEERLRELGIKVNWNHRFDDLKQDADEVTVTIEQLGGTATGYIVPHWETVVQDRFQISAQFVVGCDGYNSLVRQRLGLESDKLGEPQFFAAYEFEASTPAEDEVKVVLDATTTNVLWPLSGNKHRWTFQMVKSELSAEFPEKERRAVHVAQSNVDENIRKYVEKVAHHRAPWFVSGVKDVTWCTDVVFQHRVAKSFGHGRVWLAGDAAHQTGPVGAQSMNVGLLEAESLAGKLWQALQDNADITSLENYTVQRLTEWRSLLGIAGGLRPGSTASSWVTEKCDRLLSCIPGSGEDLIQLARQFGLTVAD